MQIVDSSGWIAFFTDSPLAGEYAKYINATANIITPTIVLYEVYKKIRRERSEEDALLAVSLMSKTSVIPLNDSIALLAADVSLKHSLPMADAIIYATALENDCDIVTSDEHLNGLQRVFFLEKK